jgi:hypothetical protein
MMHGQRNIKEKSYFLPLRAYQLFALDKIPATKRSDSHFNFYFAIAILSSSRYQCKSV